MTPYLLGWILMFGAAGLWLLRGAYVRGSIPAILIYCCILACCRGNAGTDTEYYQNMFAGVAMGNQPWRVEGGFALIATLIMKLGFSAELGVRAVAFVFFGLLAIYAWRATDSEKWILLTYLLPIFAYQYSMNGIRIGLASAALLICAQALRSGTTRTKLAAVFLPASIHYSIILSAAWIAAAGFTRRISELLIGISVTLAALFVLWSVASDYLFAKQGVYEIMVSPEAYSGLARVAVIAAVTLAVLMSGLPLMDKLVAVVPAVVLTAVSLGLARESFAGLRFLDLISFALPVILSVALRRVALPLNRTTAFAILVAGLLGSLAVARNFVNEEGSGDAPFIPYHTLWQACAVGIAKCLYS
jgi:hypothetical protein